MTNDEIKQEMIKAYDEKNAVFFQKVSPCAKNVTGVRIPYIRNMAKKIIKGDYKSFLSTYDFESHEEIILKGMVIGMSKEKLDNKLVLFKDFIPEIYDWSICDTVIGTFKFKDNELDKVFQFIEPYKKSEKEYELRVLLIVLLNYFIKEEYLKKIVDIIDYIKKDDYYVQMAAAWLISTMFVKYRDFTLEYLRDNNLDKCIQNKAVQKIRESLRVSKADKEIVNALKK